MANSPQAKKRARQGEKRRTHNASLRSLVRTVIKKVNAAVVSGDAEQAKAAYNSAVPVIDRMADKGILLLGNHISFLDWAILQMAYPKQIRFVMERDYYDKWYLKPFFDFFGVIPISSRGSKSALIKVTEALNRGETVALFPEGHLSRNGHLGTFQSLAPDLFLQDPL